MSLIDLFLVVPVTIAGYAHMVDTVSATAISVLQTLLGT